jgi:hypothetical protein
VNLGRLGVDPAFSHTRLALQKARLLNPSVVRSIDSKNWSAESVISKISVSLTWNALNLENSFQNGNDLHSEIPSRCLIVIEYFINELKKDLKIRLISLTLKQSGLKVLD